MQTLSKLTVTCLAVFVSDGGMCCYVALLLVYTESTQ